jgi:hypothetical protein
MYFDVRALLHLFAAMCRFGNSVGSTVETKQGEMNRLRSSSSLVINQFLGIRIAQRAEASILLERTSPIPTVKLAFVSNQCYHAG